MPKKRKKQHLPTPEVEEEFTRTGRTRFEMSMDGSFRRMTEIACSVEEGSIFVGSMKHIGSQTHRRAGGDLLPEWKDKGLSA
jgi:hypothetical protein